MTRAKAWLQAVERVRAYFEGPDFAPVGAAPLGLFCAADGGLFEVVSVPRAVLTVRPSRRVLPAGLGVWR